jgi:hypothetical protein
MTCGCTPSAAVIEDEVDERPDGRCDHDRTDRKDRVRVVGGPVPAHDSPPGTALEDVVRVMSQSEGRAVRGIRGVQTSQMQVTGQPLEGLAGREHPCRTHTSGPC